MSGLAALLDDVAAIAKAAASSLDDVGAAAGKASVKATGVVVDDTAVTPRYVSGITPDRELPIIGRITLGSIRNKLLIILPVALLLSQFAPWLLTPILMLGGCYLSYEGAHKILSTLGVLPHEEESPAAARGGEAEKQLVRGAVTTDLVLSAEIMVIALNEVADQPLLTRALSLVMVAFVITALVYGVVAVIVKMDDVGLHLSQRGIKAGRLLVEGMPKLLEVLSVVGVAAMLWVGGHILLVGADELGWHTPYELVHHAQHSVEHAVPHALAGTLGWITNTFFCAVVGVLVGSVVAGVLQLFHRGGHDAGDDHATEGAQGDERAAHPAPAEDTARDGAAPATTPHDSGAHAALRPEDRP